MTLATVGVIATTAIRQEWDSATFLRSLPIAAQIQAAVALVAWSPDYDGDPLADLLRWNLDGHSHPFICAVAVDLQEVYDSAALPTDDDVIAAVVARWNDMALMFGVPILWRSDAGASLTLAPGDGTLDPFWQGSGGALTLTAGEGFFPSYWQGEGAEIIITAGEGFFPSYWQGDGADIIITSDDSSSLDLV